MYGISKEDRKTILGSYADKHNLSKSWVDKNLKQLEEIKRKK